MASRASVTIMMGMRGSEEMVTNMYECSATVCSSGQGVR